MKIASLRCMQQSNDYEDLATIMRFLSHVSRNMDIDTLMGDIVSVGGTHDESFMENVCDVYNWLRTSNVLKEMTDDAFAETGIDPLEGIKMPHARRVSSDSSNSSTPSELSNSSESVIVLKKRKSDAQ
jgi:hypothetical protein